MNRRIALKAIASFAMAPLIRLRPQIDREALLLPFCGDSYKYDLQEPFQHGSLTYATDTFRIIRTELISPEVCGERRLPPAEQTWRDWWHPCGWREVERPALSDLVHRSDGIFGACPQCLDRMISLGEFYPDQETIEDLMRRGVRWDVDENTHGDEFCDLCRGRDYNGPTAITIGSQRVDYALMDPVWRLPGPIYIAANQRSGGPILFRADGFEGMAMPLI